jgi:acyl carrier protein
MYKNVPIYQAVVCDDGLGMEKISLVDDPAMESDFQFFANEEDRFKFSVQNEEQRHIFGVIIRADHPVLRLSAEGFPYYITFSKETIKTIVQKYFREGRQNNFNLMHQEGTDVDSVEMLQAFIKDKERGIDPKGFEDIEDGSLFGEFKVLDDTIWNDIKAGKFKGFSMEIFYDIEIPLEEEEEQLYSDIQDLLDQIANHLKK